MPVYKDEAKGTWYCKFRYKDWQGKAKETTKRGFKTKREAKQYESDFKQESAGTPNFTIKLLYDKYIENQKLKVKPQTVTHCQSQIVNHVLPELAAVKISDITPNTIRKWQEHLAQKGLSRSSVRTANGCFSAMLNFAVKYYGLSVNPFSVTGKTGEKTVRKKFWTLAEFNKVMDVASKYPKEYRYLLVFKILFFSGMRYGEMAGLTVDDIDFRKNTLRIDKAYHQSVHVTGVPKTRNSYRTISMPPVLMFEIRKHLLTFYEVPEYPFRLKGELIRLRIKKWSQEADVPYLPIHGFRHSHATYLISKGFPVPAVAARLGDTPETIYKNYAHATSEDDENIIANLSENCGQFVVKP